MATLSDSLVSSSARHLPMRKRPDLSARRQQYLGRSYWVVKEPVGLNYFRFQDEEFAILNMLDGHTSLDEIKERFEAEFPPQKITLEELQQFLGMLHRSGLVIASVAGQGAQLRKRRDERKRKERLGAMTNILCIRFKGFDPERFLNWIYPSLSWIFAPAVAIFCTLMAMSAATLVLVEFDTFQSKLPGFYQFFNFENGLLLAVTLGLTKVLHEFGHGLTCKHFGGECHEMGVMILVLTPCLYCNVSDSWMLPSKWQRAAIGAAGIFVEVTLASLCTFLWWFSEPGLFNNLCLNIMFVASVSTIIFNANPLLRYDGYYILADVVEIPNLRQKATTILSRKLAHWCLGMEPPEDPFLPERNQIFFALYSVTAAAYRWFVLASIMYFLYQVFKPYRLEIIGQAIISMSLYGLIVMPLYKVGKFFYVPGRVDKVKKPRMYTSLGILTALVLAVIFIPLPHSVMCVFEVQARDAVPVYVDVTGGGRLESLDVKAGDLAAAGQPLARLESIELELEIIRLEGEEKQFEEKILAARWAELEDPSKGDDLQAIEESLNAVRKRLADKKREHQRLTLVAPIDGVVLPPPKVPDKGAGDGQLAGWSGTPLDKENLGCLLEESVLLCQVGDPDQLEAFLVIDQADIEYVREALDDQLAKGKRPRVEIKLDELPHHTLHTEIIEIAQDALEVAPRRLSTKSGGDLPTVTDPDTGIERPQSASYQARAPLGLYGHDPDYGQLRGKLEFEASETDPEGSDPEGGGTWRLRYVSRNGNPDRFAGRVVLSDPTLLSGYEPGQFVEVAGQLVTEGTDNLYEVTRIRKLDDGNTLLRIGLRGQAKIETKWMPLGTRAWRFISHTFNFRL